MIIPTMMKVGAIVWFSPFWLLAALAIVGVAALVRRQRHWRGDQR